MNQKNVTERQHTLSKPKIWHLSRHGSKNGGAAAFRMHNALTQAGYRSDILVKNSYHDPHIKKMLSSFRVNCSRIQKKALSYFPAANKGFAANSMYYFFGIDETQQLFSTDKLIRKFSFQPDLIIVYFMEDFLNYQNIYELQKATGAKIYIYPMDMGPITGGCHYAWSCEGFKNECTTCPALSSETEAGRANRNLMAKKTYIDLTDLTILSPSQWQLENICESHLFRQKQAYKLLLPVDPAVFYPYPKTAARERFRLHPDKKTILVGAQFLHDKRKGLTKLLESFGVLSELVKGTSLEKDIQLLVTGRKDESFLAALPFAYRFVGLLDNETELPLAYSAADLFVCPSLQDAGPMMINESLMCGTPVVAFDMGVAKDLVVSDMTGYKAILGSVPDFAYGIFRLLTKPPAESQALRENCRNLALSHYSLTNLVNRFEEILAADLEKPRKVEAV